MKKPTKKATVKAVTFAVLTDASCKEIRANVAFDAKTLCDWLGWKLHRKVKVRDEGER